ncbi:hypothetical protein Slin14017_G039240 [Septoria linicola]|nr:hypothetical protein Slin14017_G039240 [Septoria linicola]
MEERRPSKPSGDPQPRKPHTLTKDLKSARSIRDDEIPEPEPAHIPDGIPEDEREATELHTATTRASRASRVLTPSLQSSPGLLSPIKKFWRHHVQISVPHVDCRDHLANERTFLAYMRTSVALSMMGVVMAQLWRLQHSHSPDPVFGYFVLSIPLSVIFQCSALLVVVLGAVRYWRQQEAMAIGKVFAGGWELAVVTVGSLLLLTALFALHIALDVRHTRREDL